jgi:hypothetical protein
MNQTLQAKVCKKTLTILSENSTQTIQWFFVDVGGHEIYQELLPRYVKISNESNLV